MFVLILGTLFGSVMGHNPSTFVPHLTVGLIVWGYLISTVQSGTRLYTRYRSVLMQSRPNHMSIVLRALFNSLIIFLHQAVLIVVVMLFYRIAPTPSLIYLIPALFLMFVHSVWVLVVLGILGARYRDLSEVTDMAMRIAFLATPIIWMAGEQHGQGSIVGVYLILNPLYHVLEPVRGAILGHPIDPMNWVISSALAVIGLALANFLYGRYRHLVILWV